MTAKFVGKPFQTTYPRRGNPKKTAMLAITTCQTYPDPPQNLLPLAQILTRNGIPARFDAWQNRLSEPFVLPLCAWDYAAYPTAFAQWIRESAESGQQFANPPEIMLWNMNKTYLCDLAERGADVIPSVHTSSESENIRRAMRENGWREAVVKPAIGQSGGGVVRVREGETFEIGNAPQGVIVQPYIRDIETAGETSLVFFGGTFSHAVRRQPPQGEWRANSAYGVAILPERPSETIIAAARSVLDLLPGIPAYARADGTIVGDKLLLNELELIEPALYLHTAEGAAERFAEVLTAWIEAV